MPAARMSGNKRASSLARNAMSSAGDVRHRCPANAHGGDAFARGLEQGGVTVAT